MFQDSVFNNHKNFLDGLISGTNDISSQGASQIYNSIDDDVTADSFCAEPGPIHEWIDELNTETSNEINETDIESDVVKNEWHNVDFARYLLRLSKSIVLWTGMQKLHQQLTLSLTLRTSNKRLNLQFHVE